MKPSITDSSRIRRPQDATRPVVLVPACQRQLGDHPYHVVGRKYIDAVRLAGALPLVVPAALPHEFDDLLDLADGVMLTGSPSNVHPSRFGAALHDAGLPLDVDRDAWTLPLIPRVLAIGMPLLGICRGAQEVNVALGGTLHQAVHEVAAFRDHRADADADADTQYAQAHEVDVEPAGALARATGLLRFGVNSLHGQGIDRLASSLRVEARAPDGLVEAFSMPDAPGFNLCVQWHPEWRAAGNEPSLRIFRAFGAACRAWRERRCGATPPPQPRPNRPNAARPHA